MSRPKKQSRLLFSKNTGALDKLDLNKPYCFPNEGFIKLSSVEIKVCYIALHNPFLAFHVTELISEFPGCALPLDQKKLNDKAFRKEIVV